MLSHAKKAWHLMLAFVLVSALSLPSLAFGLDTKADDSAGSDGTMQVYVKDSEGTSTLLKSYTADEFAALAEQVDAGYQYAKGDSVNVTAASKVVTYDALFADAGASAYWVDGAHLEFTCTDGAYTKSMPTYAQLEQAGYFYPARTNSDLANTEGAVEVPAGIALPYWHASQPSNGNASGDVLASVLAKLDGTNNGVGAAGTKGVAGIAPDLSTDDPSDVLDKGARMPGNVTAVTIAVPEGVTVNSIANATISAEDQLYTGEALAPVTVEDAEGNLLVEGTDYTVAYENNVEPGTASYTVTGIGAYVGQVSGTFKITDKVLTIKLNGEVAKTYTADEIKPLLNTTDTLYYGQSNHGAVQAYAVQDWVTIGDLFKDAGIIKYWNSGAKLQFVCSDGVYGKDQPSYDDLANQKFTYPNQSMSDMKNTEGAVDVPAVLAFASGRQNAGQSILSDAYQGAAEQMETSTLARAFRGWAPDADGAIEAPGWRLPSGVMEINLQPTASDLFTDVAAGSWYESSVTKAYYAGYLTGYANTTLFGTEDTLTRAQLATMLWRIGDPAANGFDTDAAKNETGLADVADGEYYTGAANWAVANGVINGVENADGTRSFEPNTPVSRETMVTVLGNYLKIAEGQDTIALNAMPDASSVSSWAANSVAWALNNEVISGIEGTDGIRTVAPQDAVTRAMAAAIFVNSAESGLLK